MWGYFSPFFPRRATSRQASLMYHLLPEASISSTLHRETSRENLAGKMIGSRELSESLKRRFMCEARCDPWRRMGFNRPSSAWTRAAKKGTIPIVVENRLTYADL